MAVVVMASPKWGRRRRRRKRRGRQNKKRWELYNIKEWTGLEFANSQRAVGNKKRWKV